MTNSNDNLPGKHYFVNGMLSTNDIFIRLGRIRTDKFMKIKRWRLSAWNYGAMIEK